MKNNFDDIIGWDTTRLNSVIEVFATMESLEEKRWVVRGHSKCFKKLIPKIDRKPFNKIKDRREKLGLEKGNIQLFRSIAFPVASKDEQKAFNHDMNTLMVLQHYGVPTRLLDWSLSPHKALFFACSNNKNDDAELWGFNYDKYLELGSEQWKKYPEIPLDSPIEVRYDIVFGEDNPKPDFFMCVFDYLAHHRIDAQDGLFSLTAHYGKDHGKTISKLLRYDKSYYHRYIINSYLKSEIQNILFEQFGIWLGSLFPDTAGAAEAIKEFLKKEANLLNSRIV